MTQPATRPGQEPTSGSCPPHKPFADLLHLRAQFLGFLHRRLHDHALAEDILQAAYLRMLASANTLRDEESAVAWFYRILRNAVIDHHRRSTRESSALERWARELEHTPAAPGPPLEDEACQCIGAALQTLTPSYSAALRSVELEGMSLADYAAHSGISAGNAAVRVHRARVALRRKILACCGACATHGCLQCTCAAAAREHLAAQSIPRT